ncbi:hypothetical protein DZS_48470 [Dickeya ananatis]
MHLVGILSRVLAAQGHLRFFFSSGHESGAGGDSVFSFGAPPLTSNSSIAGIDGIDGSGGSGGYEMPGEPATKGGNGGNGVIMIVEYSA